jgi:DNA-binding response OmpR family regulator
VEQIVRDVLLGKRVGLMGFETAEAEPIIAALREASSFGHVVASSHIPGLNSLAPYDLCIVNASALPVNGDALPVDTIARSKKPAVVIGTSEELMKHVIAFVDQNRDLVLRPFQPEELVVRAFKVLRSAESSQVEAIQPKSSGAVGRRMVLIADDDPSAIVLLTAILKHFDFDCEIAHDGNRAFALAREKKPDLVLLDVSMPKIDGFGVLTALRNDPSTKDTPVVMVTGRNNEQEVVKGFALGADDYITKPFNSGELMARINRIMRASEATLSNH